MLTWMLTNWLISMKKIEKEENNKQVRKLIERIPHMQVNPTFASEDIDPNNPPIYAYIPELGDLDEDPDDEDNDEKGEHSSSGELLKPI